MPSWDEKKRRQNIAKHGHDFAGREAIFDGPIWVYEDRSRTYGEQRLCVVGWLRGVVVHLTYTEQGNDFHVISLREADKHEARSFFQEIPR